MKIEFSFLSQSRSFIGFEINRGGYPSVNTKMEPVVQRTIDLSFGFMFGWMTLQFDFGGQFEMKDVFEGIIKKMKQEKNS